MNTQVIINKFNPRDVFDALDCKEATRKDYQYRIGLFATYIKEQEFNCNTFLNFKRWLDKRTDLKISSKNKYLIAAKILLRELSRRGQIPDITANIKCFKTSTGHKKFGLADEEMRLLETKIMDSSDLRLKTIFCLLAYQGLRQIEIVRLNFEDLNLSSGTALVLGKGKDDKEIVHLHPDTVEALKKYIEIFKIRSGILFKNESNYKNGTRLSTRAIKKIFKNIFNDLGFDADKSVHGFRHTFTTTLLKGGVDVRTARKFTRHASIQTLLIYDDEVDVADKTPEVFKLFGTQKEAVV